MFKLCSKGCEHILRALMEIGSATDEGLFQAKEICARAGVPEAYTRKVLHTLVERGFLKSTPGAGGGYALNRGMDKICLLEIIFAVEGKDVYEGCILNIAACGNHHPCPLHADWSEMRERLKKSLQSMTLQQYAAAARRLNIAGANPGKGAEK